MAMRTSRILLSLAAPALLAGCAATGGSQPLSKSTYYDDIDWEKMSVITRDAEMRGHKVWWVNPPQKRARERTEAAAEG
jgi:hypothetical protein